MEIKQINSTIKVLGVLLICVIVLLAALLNYYYTSETHNKDDQIIEQTEYKSVSHAYPSKPIPYYPDQIPHTNYQDIFNSEIIKTDEDPTSTFGADVDTGSYTNMRNCIRNGYLPSPDHIRTEEFLNYFDYHYPQHLDEDFKIYTECGPSYFGERNHMLKIGLQARSISEEEREPTTLIFVIDVSGSMADSDKLDLIKESVPYLINHLNERDRIGIVVYSSTAEAILEPSGLNESNKILNTINQLYTKDSTNVEDGLKKGYEMALEHKIDGQITRLILLSDGCANTGISSVDGLVQMVQENRKNGIYLSTYRFGMDEYNDKLMEQLADNGDGKYGYIDSLNEAKIEFIEELTGNLQTIAKDLKIQITFNPDSVEEYRLIGYDNRLMNNEDFDNHSKDAGDIGAGHSVTAIYEIKLNQTNIKKNYANITIRYKLPDSGKSIEMNFDLESNSIRNYINQTSPHFRFALCVAEFAEILKSSEKCNSEIPDIIPLANGSLEGFIYKYPKELEFLKLIEEADKLKEIFQ